MAKDWTKIYKKYKGLWIAFGKDEETILAVGKSAREVFEKAQHDGFKDPILAHMPQELQVYVGYGA